MRFDMQAARAAGYSDADIATFLAQRTGLNLQGAREAGHSDAEIAAFLAARVAGGDEGAEGEAEVAPVPAAGPRQPRSAGQEAARSLGVGARGAMHMVGALPGALYDVASLPVRGVAALTGARQPRSSAQMIDGVADSLGLPVAEGRTERLINRVATEVGATGVGMGVGRALRGLSALPGPAMDAGTRRVRAVGNALASHPGTQVAGAAGAGLAGGTAAEAGAGPLADLGASIAGGVAGAVAVPIAAGTLRGLGSAASMFTEGGAERAAAAALLRASDDPTALPERLRRSYRGLEDSAPTAGELAGDSGLLQLERALRNQPEAGPLFNLRDQGRDAARVRAIEGIEQGLPGEGTGAEEVARGIDAVGQRVRAGADDRERAAVAAAEAALLRRQGRVGSVQAGRGQQVQQSLDALPPGQTPEVAGPIIREERDAAKDLMSGRRRQAFADVDPEDASRLPLQSVLSVGEDIIGRLFRPLGAEVPDDLRRVVDDVREWIAANPDSTAPWSNLQALRSRLVDLQNRFGSGSRANGRALAVVNEMKREIDAVSRRAAEPFELPTLPRTQGDIGRDEALEAAAQNPDVDRALMQMHEEGMGWAGRDGPAGQSFLGWLRSRGGLNFADPDLSHYRDAARRYPGLASNSGLSLHRAMEAAQTSGFFPQYQDGLSLDFRQAFLETLDETLRGRGPRIGQFEGSGGARRSDFADDLARVVDQRGGVFRAEDTDETLRSIRQPAPEEAYGVPAGTEPPGQPGFVVDPRAEGFAFTPEMAARYRSAIDLAAEEGRLFDRDAMGRIGARGEGGSRSPDSVVAQQFFHGGDSGASDVQQMIQALGERGRAAQALEAYAAQSLRDFALGPDGRPVASRVRSWLQRHAAALRQMPEVQARFADVETAARTAQESAARGDDLLRSGTQARDRAVKAAGRDRDVEVARWERGAARYWLKSTEPEVAVRRALSAGNAEMNIRELRVAMRGDAPALRGLRRAYAEEWLSRVSNVNAMHADESARLRSDASRRYLQQTERAAKALFSGDELARINQIAQDFRSGSMVSSVGRAVGSNTAQNLASLRSMSTAYVLGRATQGLIRGDAGGLPSTVARPLQFLMRLPEQQVMAALADLMLDPAKAARLTEQVSARNLDMVQRYAERNAMARFGQAAADTGVRAASRAAGSVQAGEAQREARRGFAAGGVVDEPRVDLSREMPRLDGRGADGRSALERYSLPAEGDLGAAEYRMPQARLRVPEQGVAPAGVSGRRPRALGGPDMRQEQRPIVLPRPADLVPRDAGEAARGLGLGVRSAAHMALGLPMGLYDLASLPQVLGEYATGVPMAPQQSAGQLVDRAIDVTGLPRPESRGERFVQGTAQALGEGLGGIKAALKLSQLGASNLWRASRGGERLRKAGRWMEDTAPSVAAWGLGTGVAADYLENGGFGGGESEGYSGGGLAGGRVGLLGRALGAALEPYHGSPNVFDRFNLRFLGSGEGAQAFGRGHYLTESERLAEDNYRFGVLRRSGRDPDAPYRLEWDGDEARAILRGLDPADAHRLQHPFSSADDMQSFLADEMGMPDVLDLRNYHDPQVQRLAQGFGPGFLDHAAQMFEDDGDMATARAAQRLLELGPRAVPNLGATYQTRLNLDPGQLLSLDQPLRWQSGDVRRRLVDGNWGPESEEFLLRGWDRLSDPRTRIQGLEQAYQRDADHRAPADWYERVARQPMSDRAREYWSDFDPATGGVRYEGRPQAPSRVAMEDLEFFAADGVGGQELDHSPEAHAAWTDLLRAARAALPPEHASDELARIGIPGSRFLDGNSRRAGSGGHNFVIFQDEPIEIIRRYQRGGLAGA